MSIKSTVTGSTQVTSAINKPGSVKVTSLQTTASAAQIGLGAVTNESKATMFNSPTFTGGVTITADDTPDVSLLVNGNIKADNLTLNNDILLTNSSENLISADLGLTLTGGVENSPGATISLKEGSHGQFPNYIF